MNKLKDKIYSTERLTLIPISIGDNEIIFNSLKENNIADTTATPDYNNVEEVSEYINDIQKDNSKFIYKIIYNNKFIGLGKIYLSEKEDVVGYWIIKETRGKGFAVEVAKKLLFIAFEQLNLELIEANYFDDNMASKHILMKCGFSNCRRSNDYQKPFGKLYKQYNLTISKDTYINTYKTNK